MTEGNEEVLREIDVKTAVNTAMEYFAALFGGPYADLTLEEVEKSGMYWIVTLGYAPGRKSGTTVLIPSSTPRQYKIFQIDAETGEVKSMKVKKI